MEKFNVFNIKILKKLLILSNIILYEIKNMLFKSSFKGFDINQIIEWSLYLGMKSYQ